MDVQNPSGKSSQCSCGGACLSQFVAIRKTSPLVSRHFAKSRSALFCNGPCSVRGESVWRTIPCGRFRSLSESRGLAGCQQKNACHQISRAVGRHTSCRHHSQLLRVSVHPVRNTHSENHRANAAFVTRTSRELYHRLNQSIYPEIAGFPRSSEERFETVYTFEVPAGLNQQYLRFAIPTRRRRGGNRRRKAHLHPFSTEP